MRVTAWPAPQAAPTSLPDLSLLTLTLGLSSDALKWLLPTVVSSVTISCSTAHEISISTPSDEGLHSEHHGTLVQPGKVVPSVTPSVTCLTSDGMALGLHDGGQHAHVYSACAGCCTVKCSVGCRQ